jgi:hypothetical protein
LDKFGRGHHGKTKDIFITTDHYETILFSNIMIPYCLLASRVLVANAEDVKDIANARLKTDMENRI